MKKIVFGITSLTVGGAERVLVDIANRLSNEYEITIFTIYANGELESQLNRNVELISMYNKARKQLGKFQQICASLKLLFFRNIIYNKYLKNRYDTEIAFLEGAITRLFSEQDSNSDKIAWVHNDISRVFGNNFSAKIKKKLDEKIYDKYREIIVVSKENLDNFKSTYPFINEDKLHVIYNYINPESVIKKAEDEIEEFSNSSVFKIAMVARLVPQKAIDRLIKVHSKLLSDGIKHEIYIIGDGPEKENLQNLITHFKIEDTFKLLGQKQNPYPYMKQADAVALLSNFEGYGMIIEEAKILGKYIIITNTAAREAVCQYKNSKIVENNENAVYEGLKQIIQNGKISDIEIEYDNEKYIRDIKDIITPKKLDLMGEKISVLTPTYNRANLLERLYKSLLNNNSKLQIEWLIMDDGSTDNTKKVVEGFKKESKLDIKYFFQDNKGKMTALNFLVKQASGNFIIECDSDDFFTDNAFSIIANNINIMEKDTYAMCFLKYDQNMNNIGNVFKNRESTMFSLYFKEGENGEKALVFNTNIRKQYEHILEHNEKFVTEARMYHKMDLIYKMKCINEPIMICEYQKGGYSNNIQDVFKENPYGYLEYFKETFEHTFKGVSWKKRLYVIKHYILFSVLTNNKRILRPAKGVLNKILVTVLYIPGKILTQMSFF